MDENEARQVANTLQQLGIRGIVSPEDLDNPNGRWRVYDRADAATRRDITDEALTLVAGRSRQTGPARGFVVPKSR
ncbi:hypothetical protein [Kitasatospora cathayae]|uniref:PASTA domain-containing protein n=1 Tax=Kitasatospora cathayae TaxID=3004092 RepID=A0ABY7QAA5_9ACTN|nr:hypothetical protein [Kitasatospora sp. HUAS 3-15]WBP89596.1 hypothetical protein O1G21_29635 [Kitasatospora sp. HUAS 3-15]